MTITKNIIGDNRSELALSPGDDGSGNSITLPPYNKSSSTDYVTVRTVAGVHHAFATSGNYYCAGNITANSFYTTSNDIDRIGVIQSGNINFSSITSGSTL